MVDINILRYAYGFTEKDYLSAGLLLSILIIPSVLIGGLASQFEERISYSIQESDPLAGI